jgi:hypothetical protein
MENPNNKYIKYTLGALAAGFIVYQIVKKPTGGSETDPTQDGGSQPGFNAQKVVTDLLSAMASMGTNEAKVLSTLKYVTPAQFDLVFKAFGRRQYNPISGDQINPFGWFTELEFYDLQQWLEFELSETDYNVLKTKYPNKL